MRSLSFSFILYGKENCILHYITACKHISSHCRTKTEQNADLLCEAKKKAIDKNVISYRNRFKQVKLLDLSQIISHNLNRNLRCVSDCYLLVIDSVQALPLCTFYANIQVFHIAYIAYTFTTMSESHTLTKIIKEFYEFTFINRYL